MNEKNSWTMIMMMMSMTMNMIMTKKLEIMGIRTTIRPTKMMKTIREKQLQKTFEKCYNSAYSQNWRENDLLQSSQYSLQLAETARLVSRNDHHIAKSVSNGSTTVHSSKNVRDTLWYTISTFVDFIVANRQFNWLDMSLVYDTHDDI